MAILFINKKEHEKKLMIEYGARYMEFTKSLRQIQNMISAIESKILYIDAQIDHLKKGR